MIRTKLIKAGEKRRLVTVTRRKSWNRYEGYVVALSRDWCALRTVQGALVVVRVPDIRKVTTRPGKSKALKKLALWPPYAPEVLDVWDLRSLVFTAGSLSAIIGLATEHDDPKLVHTGNVFRITDRKVHYTLGRKIALKDITRVDL